MNVDTYESTDIDNDFNFKTGIAGLEIAYGSTSKKKMRKTSKHKNQIRQKLNSLSEKRFLDRQLNSLSDHWDM
jgi:hypothetical protein